MSEPTGEQQKGRPEPSPKSLQPQRIPGLIPFIAQESLGGTAGANRTAANAVFIGEGETRRLAFTNFAQRDYGRVASEVTIRIKYQHPKILETIRKARYPEPPGLIDYVSVVEGVREEDKNQLMQQILEHNAYEILEYLKVGGDPFWLPKGIPYMPDLDELRKLL